MKPKNSPKTNGHPSVERFVGTSRLDVVVLVIQQQVKLGQDPEIGAKNNMALEPIALSLGIDVFLKENDTG